MVTVTVQAFRGQALIHPDGRTLSLAAGFAAISCVALAVVVAAARRVGVRHATVEAKQFERLGL